MDFIVNMLINVGAGKIQYKNYSSHISLVKKIW